MSLKDAAYVTDAQEGAKNFRGLLGSQCDGDEHGPSHRGFSRERLGMCLHTSEAAFLFHALLAVVDSVVEAIEREGAGGEEMLKRMLPALLDSKEASACTLELPELEQPSIAAILARAEDMFAAIHSLRLEAVWERPLLLDGDAVKQVFSKMPKGPLFKEVMTTQLRWMLRHPEGTKEQCVTHLLELHPECV